jgi:hypothetical protein
MLVGGDDFGVAGVVVFSGVSAKELSFAGRDIATVQRHRGLAHVRGQAGALIG